MLLGKLFPTNLMKVTYIIDGTDRIIIINHYSILFSDWSWLQFFSCWLIVRFRRFWHVFYVINSFFQYLKCVTIKRNFHQNVHYICTTSCIFFIERTCLLYTVGCLTLIFIFFQKHTQNPILPKQ